MRKMLKITVREYNAAVRTKGFLIGLAIAPVLMSGSAIVMVLFEHRVDTTPRRIAIVDRSGVVASYIAEEAQHRNASDIYDSQTGEQIGPAFIVELVEPDDQDPDAQRLALSNRVRAKELLGFVEIGKDVLHPGDDPQAARVTYHSENPLRREIREWMVWPLNRHLRNLRAAAADLDQDVVNQVVQWRHIEGLGLVSVDEGTGDIQGAKRTSEGEIFGVPLILVMLMFLMIMMGSTPLLYSVLEEKVQRIAEVLLGSIRPFALMMGKLLGAVAVSFTGMAVYVVGGIIAAHYLDLAEYIPYELLPWFFVYMVAAVLMFGAAFAAVGSACNDAKEVQSLMLPVMLPAMIPMFVLVPVLKEPSGAFATCLSLVPPCVPTVMLLRQATPMGVPAWQPWVALAGVLASTLLCVWVSGRIFRVCILMQGKPPRITDLARWAVRG